MGSTSRWWPAPGRRSNRLAQQIEARRAVSAHVVPIDLATPDAARRVVSELAARRIRADALMNCAGFNRFGPFVEGDERRIMELLQVNMAALPHLTRLVLPGMVERGWGRRS